VAGTPVTSGDSVPKLSRFMVVTASPANSTASLRRKSDTGPVCDRGVSIISQSGRPGICFGSRAPTRVPRLTVLVGKNFAIRVRIPVSSDRMRVVALTRQVREFQRVSVYVDAPGIGQRTGRTGMVEMAIA